MSNPIWIFDLTISGDYPVMLVKETFKSLAKKWVFQREVGATTGYDHFQCRLNLRERSRLSKLVSQLHEHGITKCKVSATSKNAKERFTYVMKEETRTEGPWTDRDYNLPPRLLVTIDNPKPWQRDIDAIQRDDRKVYFVIDEQGNAGKTTFALARAAKNPLSLYVKLTSSVEQIEQALFAKLENYEPFQSMDIYINIPRTHIMHDREKARLANLLETIKDGQVTDCRYKYREAWINTSKVIVFSNEDLDITRKLSADRSVTYHIRNNVLMEGISGASL